MGWGNEVLAAFPESTCMLIFYEPGITGIRVIMKRKLSLSYLKELLK